MLIALCFLVSHELNKEALWRKWVDQTTGCRVFFHCQRPFLVQSEWIRSHMVKPQKTSYYHVIPAYLALIEAALGYSDSDSNSDVRWFCFLTESCVPIVSPEVFLERFSKDADKSLLRWSPAAHNVQLHRRANLRLLPLPWRLCHDPWFVLTRRHAVVVMRFAFEQKRLLRVICNGGLANESLFAIILEFYGALRGSSDVLCEHSSTATDWTQMSSKTGPHVFHDERDLPLLQKTLAKNPQALFLRKVSASFPERFFSSL
jgi:hypothetical protein